MRVALPAALSNTHVMSAEQLPPRTCDSPHIPCVCDNMRQRKSNLGCHAIYLPAVDIRGLALVVSMRRRFGSGASAHGVDECVDDDD
jgi:hypothetical protein